MLQVVLFQKQSFCLIKELNLDIIYYIWKEENI